MSETRLVDPTSEAITRTLQAWQETLCQTIDIGGLFTRNPVAHKWKAPFRCLCIREGLCWRTHDLLSQSTLLHSERHELGARILLRSAFESLAVLIYLNQLMAKVIAGTENFHDFSDKTARLLIGSKDKSTQHEAINIMTILGKADAKLPGIYQHYEVLSETAHPNFEGICLGYVRDNREEFVSYFSNRWFEVYGDNHLLSMSVCITMFLHEYNTEWAALFPQLESWIAANDAMLEATKK